MTTALLDVLPIDDLRALRLACSALAQNPAATKATRARYTALADRVGDVVMRELPGPKVFELCLPLVVKLPRPPPRALKKALRSAKPRKPFLDVKLAPRLNELVAMKPWELEKSRAEIDRWISDALAGWAAWDCGSARSVVPKVVKLRKGGTKTVDRLVTTGGRRRIVEVIRRSSGHMDEVTVDASGGKLVIDRLVWAGVLAGDATAHVLRRARWEPAPPGQGTLEVHVYELGAVEG